MKNYSKCFKDNLYFGKFNIFFTNLSKFSNSNAAKVVSYSEEYHLAGKGISQKNKTKAIIKYRLRDT